MRLILERFIINVKDLDLAPRTLNKSSLSSASASVSWKKTFKGIRFLIPYGTKVTDNSLLICFHLAQHMFILQTKHGIFYMDESKRMCFQCSNDFVEASTKHLIHLRIVYIIFTKLTQNYHFSISTELNNRKKKLSRLDYFWVDVEVKEDVNEFYCRSEEV